MISQLFVPRTENSFDRLLIGCVFISAWCSLAGWGLSACGWLDFPGYCVVIGISLGIWAVFLRKFSRPNFKFTSYFGWQKARKRGLLAQIFFVSAILAGVGGFLHAPNNYDALTYRLPRLLHWLSENRWHWIETVNLRMNFSGPGQEWLFAPQMALLQSDRFLFLTNWIPFLLLPGLIFATFTRLGIPARVARVWMWLLPTSLSLLLQAGSVGNDMLGGFYLLAAIYLAQRSVESGRLSYLLWSVAAVSQMTALKASNLPLVLPWLVSLWPVWKYYGKAILPILPAAVILGICTSILPTLAMNSYFAGDWTGDPSNSAQVKITNPIAGLTGNTLQTAAGFLQPPIFPAAAAWNRWSGQILPESVTSLLKTGFPRFNMRLTELPQEESAGVGLAITICLGTLFLVRGRTPRLGGYGWQLLVCLSIIPCLTVFFVKFGSESSARLLSPYYFLFTALLLHWPGAALAVSTRWWKIISLVSAASAFLPLILTPSRPLWPAQAFLKIVSEKVNRPAIERARLTYATYALRNRSLHQMSEALSPAEKELGFVGLDDAQTGLWQPYGSRKVIEVTPRNATIILQKIPLVVSGETLSTTFKLSPEAFADRYNMVKSKQEPIVLKIGQGAINWYLFSPKPPIP